ncbi:AAA family ATPase [Actinomadura scrupuli]|uniref:helix-turn-helix transcriptional regulator n=1 Tax=Actinomadura scrupuli TaxID=559629 RepID=UPI003D98B5C0
MQGREHGRQVVLGLLRSAEAHGRGGVLLVEGEPGMGKTSLLTEANELAAGMGFSLATGVAEELGQIVPMAPLLTALDEVPEPGLDVPDQHIRSAQRLWSRLERRATAGPALLTLDDLHWADPTTLLLLRTLPRQLSSRPLVWILARSAGDHGNDAGRLFALLESEGAIRLELVPLDQDAVTELITELLGTAPAPELLALAAGAGGNPFLLVQLVTGLRDEGALDLSPSGARPAGDRLPRRLQAVVRRRLEALSPEVRHFLEIAAVLGRSFVPGDAAEMLAERPAMIWPCVEEALSTDLLTATNDEIVFRHELVWRCILDGLPGPMRQALHRQAGEMLLDRGGCVVPAAAHLIKGARRGDSRALAGLDEAVAEVFPSSPQTAADVAVRALELTDQADPGRFARTVVATEACAAAGRLDTATELVRSALTHRLPVPATAQLHSALSTILYLSGRAAEARDEAAAALSEPLPPGGLRDDAELAMLHALAGLRDNVRAGELATAVLEDRKLRGDALIVGAMVVLSVIKWDEARLAEALGLCREAVRRAGLGSAEARRIHPGLTLAGMLADVRLIEEAGTAARAAAEEVQSLGHVAWAGGPAILGSRLDLATGRLDDAVAAATAGLEITESLGTHLFTAVAKSVLGTVALRRGDLRTAEGLAVQDQGHLAHYGMTFAQPRCGILQAQAAEARGDPTAALELLAGIVDELPAHPGVLVADPATASWLVRVALAADDPRRAGTVVEAAESIALANPGFPAVNAAAAHARGLLDGEPDALERAVKEHVDPWARASATEDLGEVLAADGDRRQAVHSLERAIAHYEESGARRDAARVRRRLRRLGVRHRHWASAERPVTGWASLTDTERSVSELVAQGLTNQQTADQMFLSVHTVAFHLRQVFRKLGISSRVDLTRIALRQER